jgi:hypothetical protein
MFARVHIPLDADNKDNLGLSRDVVRAGLLGLTRKADLLTLGVAVLLDVGLGALEDDLALLLVGLIQICQQWVSAKITTSRTVSRIDMSVPKDG